MSGTPPIGRALKHWRKLRGRSQLQLANDAAISSRHLSFVESGRSRPSEDMVLRLAAALALPLRERNALLVAAGFAPLYAESPLHADALAPHRQVIDLILRCHEPFPALVIDRAWNVLEVNAATSRLFPHLRGARGPEALRLFYGPGAVRDAIVNFREVAWHGFERLQQDAAEAGYPPELTALVEGLHALLSDVPRPLPSATTGAVACPVFQFGERRVRTMTTLTSFKQAGDVTLQELRIEQIFPADAESEAFFRELAAAAGPGDGHAVIPTSASAG